MVPLVSMAAVVWFVVQWTCSILVLLIVGALLAETSPPSSSVAGAVNDSREGGGDAQHSAGKRAVELLLAAFGRLGVPVEWLREILMSEGGVVEGRRGEGVLKRFRARKRGVAATPSKPQREERRARVCLEGASLSLSDIRIVDNKFACYRITVTPGANALGVAGAPREVWRRMADMIKLKAALSKVSAADAVDLPPLPHSYRRSFDASRLTRRRRRIQHFLQVALENRSLRECDALVDFLSPEVAGAVPARPRGLPTVTSSASISGSVTGGGGSGGGGESTSPRPRARARSVLAVAAPGGAAAGAVKGEAGPVAGNESGSGSGSGGGRRRSILSSAAGDSDGGGRGGQPSDLPAPRYLAREDDEEGLTSGSSSDEDVGVGGEAGAVGAAGWGSGHGVMDGGMPVSPPRSPLGLSSKNSGRKSMDYMKNAVMTGTRRIARHVPMSMPNPKAIQRHIPMPKGVPKFPTKYNPYKRSSNRRSNTDSPEVGLAAGGSMADMSAGGGGGGGGGFVNDDGDLNGLTWQGDDGYNDSGSGISGSGMSLSGSGGNGAGGGGGVAEDGTASPRRRSYLWKRPISKPGGGGGGGSGGGQSGVPGSGNGLLRAKSDAATAGLVAAGTADGQPESSVVKAMFDGSSDQRPCSGPVSEKGAEGKGVAMLGGAPGGGSESAPATAAAAAAAAAAGRGESGEGPPGLAVPSGGNGNGGGGGGAVQTAGITDGGEGHRFKVRGASFLSDGVEVQGEPALCPLVYAELFSTADHRHPSQGPPKAAAAAAAAATQKREARATAATGRVDHIAAWGRCATRITELTERNAGEGDDGAAVPPFLIIFNFQVPGDPPLSLVAAWAVQPESLGPDSPDSHRRFFGLFYGLVNIPLSPLPPECSLSESPSGATSGEDERREGTDAGAAGGESADNGDRNSIDAVNGNSGSDRPPEVTARISSNGSGRSPGSYVQGNGGGSGRKDDSTTSTTGGVLGRDDLRNQRLKLAVRLLDGPRVVAKALPSAGSVMLGQKATLRFFRGERYLEVDADLGSSLATSQVTALCRQNAKSLALDVGVILHGDTPGELPEGVLGVLRIEGLDLQDTARHRPLWE
ncbi:unnamed protein product [Pylaiella littoralis]